MDALASALDYWQIAARAIDNLGMTVALVLLACILAAVGGFAGWRMRLYGAVVGAMLMNAVVKAMGGGFLAALIAALAVASLAFAVGSVPFLVAVLKRARSGRRVA
jgi:hypothetical protein